MKIVYTFLLALIFGACSSTHITSSAVLPTVDEIRSISIFALDNYTDTPQAGMRAANLIEGVLISQGYTLDNQVMIKTKSLEEKLRIASENGSDYLLIGGVSEWRYKTGIDGEPAISLQCKLIEVSSSAVIWNSTASSNDWGNASIGTTAQEMIVSMFDQE